MADSLLYTPKVGGKWADFGSGGHPSSWYDSLAQAGFDGVFLDTYSASSIDSVGALQAGLGVMLVQGYYVGAWPVLAQAGIRAQQAVSFAKSINYLKGGTIFLDFESCMTSYTEAAAWINSWAKIVTGSGYFPGIYVGAPEPLSGEQLYNLLVGMMHYWKSESTVPMVARRGYQVIQESCNVMQNGVFIDIDRIQMDNLGGLPHGIVLAKSKPKPKPMPDVSDVSALKTQIADLEAKNKSLLSVLSAIQRDLRGV
jgi:hypothetical protein